MMYNNNIDPVLLEEELVYMKDLMARHLSQPIKEIYSLASDNEDTPFITKYGLKVKVSPDFFKEEKPMTLEKDKPKKFFMLCEKDKDGDVFFIDGVRYPDHGQAAEEAERLIQTGAYHELYIMVAHTRVTHKGILFESLS